MTSENKPEKTFILIDNNLLRQVYNKDTGDQVFSTLYTDSQKLELLDIRKQEAVITPFSLLEAIGFGKVPSVSGVIFDGTDLEKARSIAIKIAPTKEKIRKRLKELAQASLDSDRDEQIRTLRASIQPQEKEISELIENIRSIQYKKYLEVISQAHELTPESLQTKYREQCNWLSKLGREAFEKLFERHIKDKKDTDYISQFLAFDAVYKFEWPKELHLYRDMHTVADLFRSLHDDLGVMQTRGLKYLWIYYSEKLLKSEEWRRFKRTEEEFRKELSEATESIDLKTREDLLDTEMLQFLVTGKMHQGSFTPVYVYTMEAVDKFTKRVALMKTLIQSCRTAFLPDGFPLPEFRSGVVVFVSDNGAITNTIAVADIQPFLADR